MELKNEAQGKAFRADSKVVTRKGSEKAFVSESAGKQKTFADTRAAAQKEFRSGSDRTNLGQNSFVSIRDADTRSHSKLVTSSARDVRPAYDARLAVSGRTFADEPTFREEGKSQKSLSRKNAPLTIDQVRELLNKNK
jgi:hypothetical protein